MNRDSRSEALTPQLPNDHPEGGFRLIFGTRADVAYHDIATV